MLERVIQVDNEFLGVCKRLHAAGALTKKHVLDILTGLTIHQVP